MNGFIEILGILALIAAGMASGKYFSGLKSPWWLTGYLLPMCLVLMVAISRFNPSLSFREPFVMITRGRTEFVLMAAAITMMFMTLLPRLHNRRTRRLLLGFMALTTPYFSLTPFLGPLLVRHELNHLEMNMFPGGICVQSTNYTCGPAAMVSALWQLGIKAEEGDLAIRAYTNPFSGTPEDLLLEATLQCYGDLGVECEYRQFRSMDELRQAGLTVALVRFRFMIDHYVTVFEVNEDSVVLADPAEGSQRISVEQFERTWKRTGIILRRRDFHYQNPTFFQTETTDPDEANPPSFISSF